MHKFNNYTWKKLTINTRMHINEMYWFTFYFNIMTYYASLEDTWLQIIDKYSRKTLSYTSLKS